MIKEHAARENGKKDVGQTNKEAKSRMSDRCTESDERLI